MRDWALKVVAPLPDPDIRNARAQRIVETFQTLHTEPRHACFKGIRKGRKAEVARLVIDASNKNDSDGMRRYVATVSHDVPDVTLGVVSYPFYPDGVRNAASVGRTTFAAKSSLAYWRTVLKNVTKSAQDDFSTRFLEAAKQIADDFCADDFDGLAQEIKPLLCQAERQKIRAGLREFLGALDQDALRAMYKARTFKEEIYVWCVGKMHPNSARLRATPAMCNRRKAALLQAPLLVNQMTDTTEEAYHLTADIDAGLPLWDALTRMMALPGMGGDPEKPVTREFVTWMKDKNRRLVDGYGQQAVGDSLNLHYDLAYWQAVPREWRPRTYEEARTLQSVFAVQLGGMHRLTGRKKTDLLVEYMSACRRPRGLPNGFLPAFTANGLPTNSREAMYETLKVSAKNDSLLIGARENDFLGDIGNKIVLAEIFRRAARSGYDANELLVHEPIKLFSIENNKFPAQALRLVFKDLTAVKVISLSNRWHENLPQLRVRTSKLDTEAMWAPLFSRTINPDTGVVYECLTSTKALKAEAELLGHCVHGYTFQCAVGNSHVITVRAGDGSWATTLEVGEFTDPEDRSKRKLVYLQHEGVNKVRDAKLPLDQQNAAMWIIDAINGGRLVADWGAVDAARAVHRKDAVLMRIGFDPMNDAAVDEAYAALHGTFRDVFKEPTREAFLKNRGISAFLAQHVG